MGVTDYAIAKAAASALRRLILFEPNEIVKGSPSGATCSTLTTTPGRRPSAARRGAAGWFMFIDLIVADWPFVSVARFFILDPRNFYVIESSSHLASAI